jgi:hypothetical protein
LPTHVLSVRFRRTAFFCVRERLYCPRIEDAG